MNTVVSADGTDVRVYDEGKGPVILMVHPGLDDGTGSKKLAAILAQRHRVLRLHRRQYRLDLKADGARYSIAQEVADVLAVARTAGEPVLVYGHSSGAVVTLEALAAEASLFAGAVIFEPPTMIGPPVTGEGGEVVVRARAAITAGRRDRAMRIFTRQGVGLPLWQATLMGTVPPRFPASAGSCRVRSTTSKRYSNSVYAWTPIPRSPCRQCYSVAIAARRIWPSGSTPSKKSCRTANA